MTTLEGFVVGYDDLQAQYYAYCIDTGETIMGLLEDGNATGIERRYSQWRLPYEDMSEATIQELQAWVEYEDETDPLVASMTVEEGGQWYSKRYDASTGYFYFQDLSGGGFAWTKPPGLPVHFPCSDFEEYDDRATLLQGLESFVSYQAPAEDTTGYDYGYEEGAAADSTLSLPQLTVRPQTTEAAGYSATALAMTARPATGNYDDSNEDGNSFHASDYTDTDSEFSGLKRDVVIKIEKDRRVANQILHWNAKVTRGGGGHFNEDYGGFMKQTDRSQDCILPWMDPRSNSGPPPFKYLDVATIHQGPWCRRTGKGKQVYKAINKLPPANSPETRVARAAKAFTGKKGQRKRFKEGTTVYQVPTDKRLYIKPADYNWESWNLGEPLSYFDGFIEHESNVEAYGIARAAYESGGDGICDLMGDFNHRPDVLVFCLQGLAKTDYQENPDDGTPNTIVVRAIQAVLHAMLSWAGSEAVQAHGLNALANFSDNFASRKAIMEQDWVGATVKAMQNLQTQKLELHVKTENGTEIKELREPTRQAIDTAIHGCKLFANMACDSANRQSVADDGVDMVLHAMTFCPEEQVVQLYGCKALYNFCYRCEGAHFLCHEADAIDVVELISENFPYDKELVLIADRTKRALEPDGWRGGADEPGMGNDDRIVG